MIVTVEHKIFKKKTEKIFSKASFVIHEIMKK